MARHIYAVPEGKNNDADRLIGALNNHLNAMDRVDEALRALHAKSSNLVLANVVDKADRQRIKDALTQIGLTARVKGKQLRVEVASDKSKGRVDVLRDVGLDIRDIAHRLNAGQPVHLSLAADDVPITFGENTWSVLFGRRVPASRLFTAILSDRRAALLAYGLSWLDETTLLFLDRNPAIVKRLYEDDAAVFAAFGRSLRIAGNRIIVPGGESASPLWEAVVGEAVTAPDKFVHALFGRHAGKVAYLYDTIASLDASHARFALGLWISDPATRRERFEALEGIASSAYPGFAPVDRPFWRPAADIPILLSRVRVGADGVPASPAWRRFWKKVFDGPDLPDEASKELRGLKDDGTIDAAWLAEQTSGNDAAERTERIDQLSFAQRVFRGTPDVSLPNVLVATRALVRFRALMLTLERLGVEDPALYADAARRGDAITTLDHNKAFNALAQFQSALDLLTRLRMTRAIHSSSAQQLVRGLVQIEPHDGRYLGSVARWLEDTLLPALACESDVSTFDDCISKGLAGVTLVRSNGPNALPLLTFENRTYRVDLAGAALRRLQEIRLRQGGYTLGQVVSFARDVRRVQSLAAQSGDLGALRQASGAIRNSAASLAADRNPPPPGTEPVGDPRKVVAEALRQLDGIKKPKDVRKAQDVVVPLLHVVDDLLARTLLSYAYALVIGDSGSDALLGGDPAWRHDFGFLSTSEKQRKREAWQIPSERFGAGVPWHVEGSALALDVGLAQLQLRRLSQQQAPRRPLLTNAAEKRTFTEVLALLDTTADLNDAADTITAAVARGRSRVHHVRAVADLEVLFNDVHVDGFRQQAMRWSVGNEPGSLERWWSLPELAALGDAGGDIEVQRFGTSALASDACLCVQFHESVPWYVFTSQVTTGVLPSKVADLNVRILEVFAELRLPASLLRAVLALALNDYLDEVQPSDVDDWLALMAGAQRFTSDRIADYVGALTTDGTLVHVEVPDQQGTHR